MNTSIEEEPPIQLKKFKSVWTKVQTAVRAVFSIPKAANNMYLIPLILVLAVTVANVAQGSSYTSDLSNYVVMEPKTKISAMRAIDQFTPFVEESKDAEPVVVAEITPEELVLTKPSIAKTEHRADEVKEPVKREGVITHVVQPGETLSVIASNYGLKMASIQVENKNFKSIDKLSIGDELKVPPQDYDQTYVNKMLKTTAVASKVATSTSDRSVVVRGTSTARYDNDGEPAFGRPAGALGQNGYHSWAIDIPPSGGTGIYAAAGGVVVEVASGWNGGYGNKIVIDHGSGWQTLYGHLESINVSPGQTVSRGQVIGVMGATGRTYPKGAVHLHFEIRQNGVRLNPIYYIQ